jgi:hypothetical protein
LEWTKDEIKESAKHGVVEIESGIRLKDGSLGRILAVNASVPGKIGSKVLPFSPSHGFRLLTSVVPYVKKLRSSRRYSKPSTSRCHPRLSPHKL